ncbi:hypothetical protein CIPAW_03G180500 [Carya illinoinensis]|uniref:Uncharacterized protein n=1 Tax=Carya illinoinensis TaxID=32201 RepID=A0A8T1R520_CARIL|nr:hypothetical protein CIPAW_03G180500 [Carya illinoinensis]
MLRNELDGLNFNELQNLEDQLSEGVLSVKAKRPSIGNILEKIVSDYHILYGGQLDEEVVLSKCTNAPLLVYTNICIFAH